MLSSWLAVNRINSQEHAEEMSWSNARYGFKLDVVCTKFAERLLAVHFGPGLLGKNSDSLLVSVDKYLRACQFCSAWLSFPLRSCSSCASKNQKLPIFTFLQFPRKQKRERFFIALECVTCLWLVNDQSALGQGKRQSVWTQHSWHYLTLYCSSILG